MESVSKMDIRQSAKKVRHVLDGIKNLKVNDALKKMSFTNKNAISHRRHAFENLKKILP